MTMQATAQELNVRHGVFVVENLDTRRLAADGVREFALILTHPKLRGVSGAWTSRIALIYGLLWWLLGPLTLLPILLGAPPQWTLAAASATFPSLRPPRLRGSARRRLLPPRSALQPMVADA